MHRDAPAPASSPLDARLHYGEQRWQFGDLRLPAGPGPHPAVVVLHGGYWRARYGSEYMARAAAALTRAGYATWNVEYRRLCNAGGGWPGTFLDVAAAADFLGRIDPHYDLDTSSVISLGHSAGGHLALWLAARHRLPLGSSLSTSDPLPIRGVVSLAGIPDLSLAAHWMLSDGAAIDLMGGTPAELPERYQVGSPASLLPLGLPQILLHGTEDQDVPFTISERYTAAARAAGDAVELIPLPGGHFELVDPNSRQWSHVPKAITRLLAL